MHVAERVRKRCRRWVTYWQQSLRFRRMAYVDGEVRTLWPGFLAEEAATWLFWRPRSQLRGEYQNLRHWLARGKTGSRWWVPRVGDLVNTCSSGDCVRVERVSIREGLVWLDNGRTDDLYNCVDPYPPGRAEKYEVPD
jgi:hypothetical protein